MVSFQCHEAVTLLPLRLCCRGMGVVRSSSRRRQLHMLGCSNNPFISLSLGSSMLLIALPCFVNMAYVGQLGKQLTDSVDLIQGQGTCVCRHQTLFMYPYRTAMEETVGWRHFRVLEQVRGVFSGKFQRRGSIRGAWATNCALRVRQEESLII